MATLKKCTFLEYAFKTRGDNDKMQTVQYHFNAKDILELKSRYSRLYSGVVYDALHEDIQPLMPYVLSKNIKSAWDFDEVLCGPAFTVQGAILTDKKHANAIYVDMLDSLYNGCIEMISSGVDNKLSVFGEITGKIAARQGAIGTVIDACTRDVSRLKADGYKVFSEGVSMIDALDRWHIVNYQIPLPFHGEDGDVWVNPGDYIFADCDGVLVIPHRETFRTLESAEMRLQREDRIRELIKQDVPTRDILEKEGRW
jgi:regulator of RNase E activity RraA